mmetsp:Transcript_16237/g.18712  ORF Transcript_16237/g.18712 Transcript_16237/m.18712 type:complete len:85 (+) Transcript_16237:213-467(+)
MQVEMTHDDDDDGIHGYNILERSPSPSLPSELKKQKNSNTKNNSVSAIIVIDPIEKKRKISFTITAVIIFVEQISFVFVVWQQQ